MKGAEFIGIYKGGGKVRDAVRGVILDAGLFNEPPLMVFYFGGYYMETTWKKEDLRKSFERGCYSSKIH